MEIDINLARLLMSFCAGTLLAVSGTLIQGVTQNELAGSSTLGIDGIVVLLILLVHFTMMVIPFPPHVSLESLSFLVFVISANLGWWILRMRERKRDEGSLLKNVILGNRHRGPMTIFILLGLCFNLFVGAIFTMLNFLFMTLNMQFPTQIWYGNFRFVANSTIVLVLASTIMILIGSFKLGRKLRMMSFGADVALSLGIPVRRTTQEALYLSILAVGVITSFFGVFSFLGLIFPHLLRTIPFFRFDIRKEIILGAPLCGLLLSLLDWLCFNFPLYGAEVPVGMISALVGTLVLVLILLKKHATA